MITAIVYFASLFSDQWIAELEYRRPVIPSSNLDSNLSLLKPLDFREVPPERPARYRYRDLPSDVQRDLLGDINREIIDYEVNTMLREITGQTISNKVRRFPRRKLPSRFVLFSFQFSYITFL